MERNVLSENLYNFTFEGLKQFLKRWKYREYHCKQIFHYLYRDHVKSVEEMADLHVKLKKKLSFHVTLDQAKVLDSVCSNDGFTRKYLLELVDGKRIETVAMEFKGRYTACVSTQVGCAMGVFFVRVGKWDLFVI